MTWGKEQLARIRELHSCGLTVSEIAKDIGVPKGWITVELQGMGYMPRLHREKAESEFLKGKYVKIWDSKKEDKPMKAAQINEEFDKAVDEMIAEAKEKEPASVGADASSEVRNSPNISTSNDTTDKPESQAVSGITALSLLESALLNAYGTEVEIIDINANADHCDIGFAYHGKEYCLLFAEREEVPAYGNDKH